MVRLGPVEGVSSCGDRATAPYEYICNSSHRPKFMYHRVHNGRCAMWIMSDAETVIFVAIVAVMVALALLLLA